MRRQTYGYLPSRRASPPLDRTEINCLVNNLPKVFTRKRKGRESNSRPFVSRANTLTITPPGHTHTHARTHARTHTFNGPLSGTTRVSRYQKGKTNLNFTEARDSEWHQLGHVQVCTLLQTDNHASTQPLSFLQAGCPSCRPTNSVKAPKAPGHKKRRRKKQKYLLRLPVPSR